MSSGLFATDSIFFKENAPATQDRNGLSSFGHTIAAKIITKKLFTKKMFWSN